MPEELLYNFTEAVRPVLASTIYYVSPEEDVPLTHCVDDSNSESDITESNIFTLAGSPIWTIYYSGNIAYDAVPEILPRRHTIYHVADDDQPEQIDASSIVYSGKQIAYNPLINDALLSDKELTSFKLALEEDASFAKWMCCISREPLTCPCRLKDNRFQQYEHSQITQHVMEHERSPFDMRYNAPAVDITDIIPVCDEEIDELNQKIIQIITAMRRQHPPNADLSAHFDDATSKGNISEVLHTDNADPAPKRHRPSM